MFKLVLIFHNIKQKLKFVLNKNDKKVTDFRNFQSSLFTMYVKCY